MSLLGLMSEVLGILDRLEMGVSVSSKIVTSGLH